MSAFGQYFKYLRIQKKKTLREFCRENNLDAANISKLERGLFLPPRDFQTLKNYMSMLDVEQEPGKRCSFIDLARGEHIIAAAHLYKED